MTDTFHNQKKKHFTLFSKKNLRMFLSQFVWLVETSLCLIYRGIVWCYRRVFCLLSLGLQKNVKFVFHLNRAVSVRTRTGVVSPHGLWFDHCLVFPKDVPNIDFLSHQCSVDPWDSWILSWITSTPTTAKKEMAKEHRAAASSHLPNIKCEQKL